MPAQPPQPARSPSPLHHDRWPPAITAWLMSCWLMTSWLIAAPGAIAAQGNGSGAPPASDQPPAAAGTQTSATAGAQPPAGSGAQPPAATGAQTATPAPETPPTTAAPPPAGATPSTATPATQGAPAGTTGSSPAPATKPAPAKGKAGAKTGAAKPAAPVKPPPPPPKPPVPNAALAQLKTLVGSWTCTGHTFGPGPEHDTAATLTFGWRLDGFWLEVHYDEAKTAANTAPMAAVGDWGYDELQPGLAAMSVDSFGGSAAQSAAGWQGNKLIFEGPAHRFSAQFQARDTYVRQGDARLGHTAEAEVNGSWIKLHQDVCNRQPAP